MSDTMEPIEGSTLARFLIDSQRILVVHHWDVDGLSAAAMVARYLVPRGIDLGFHVPTVGVYGLEALDVERIESFHPDLLLVLDYGIPFRDLAQLSRMLEVPIAVVDHHRHEEEDLRFVNELMSVLNPVAFGGREDAYPSTSYVLNAVLRLTDVEDLVALSIVGDLGNRIAFTKWMKFVRDVSSLYGYDANTLFSMANLVNACYQAGLGDECFDHVRKILSRNAFDVVRDGYLAKVLHDIEKDFRDCIERAHASRRELGKVMLFETFSEYNLVSRVGRALADAYPRNVVVLQHHVKNLGKSYIYVRSHSYDLSKVLEELRKRVAKIGGKDRVFVVTCMNTSCPELEIVLDAMKRFLGGSNA